MKISEFDWNRPIRSASVGDSKWKIKDWMILGRLKGAFGDIEMSELLFKGIGELIRVRSFGKKSLSVIQAIDMPEILDIFQGDILDAYIKIKKQ